MAIYYFFDKYYVQGYRNRYTYIKPLHENKCVKSRAQGYVHSIISDPRLRKQSPLPAQACSLLAHSTAKIIY